MSETAFTVPRLGWEIPKPRFWDFVAIGLLVLAVLIAGWTRMAAANLAPGEDISAWLSGTWAALQLALSIGSLMVLGKTAKEGTIHGILAAVLGCLMGLNGLFLAAALSILA